MRRTTDRWRTVQTAAAATTWLAMVATPLNRPTGPVRRVLSTIVVSGLFVTTFAGSVRRWGAVRATGAAAATTVATTWVEGVGTRTGVPFGGYQYTRALQPQVVGVPAIVPLAWFAMAVPARETAHAALGDRSTPATRIVAGAAALTAWDLFLDPQMVGEGYWRWARRGVYRGIPLSNFAGWFVTSLGVMAALEVLLPADDRSPDLVAEYGVMAAMETVGFAAFFRDRVVAVVGGTAMLPVATLGLARLIGRRRA
jgi:putative membrane protein